MPALQDKLSPVLPSMAILTGSLLSGAMLSHALTIPIILDTTVNLPASLIVAQWSRTFHYGHLIMPPVAIGTLALYLAVLYTRRQAKAPVSGYATAALMTVAIIPFTLMFMGNTNAALFKLEDEFSVAAGVATQPYDLARKLVTTWGYLHLCRAVMPFIGACVGFSTFLQERKADFLGSSSEKGVR
ncbi:hypothetical protein LTR97_001864 [Elasticomyces elasticus]|uniref:Anthrone oxygenase n=1 Tax=Elasticomyces elasticus TaxID=574655 RepID=A0AAN7WIA6_9PEZI|nr:hypothetical protein LTR97_001864 [Elasticomyces elasticus]KAK5713218.1 hypothetical protein LTR15_011581 [Elasticomyces elasticus]